MDSLCWLRLKRKWNQQLQIHIFWDVSKLSHHFEFQRPIINLPLRSPTLSTTVLQHIILLPQKKKCYRLYQTFTLRGTAKQGQRGNLFSFWRAREKKKGSSALPKPLLSVWNMTSGQRGALHCSRRQKVDDSRAEQKSWYTKTPSESLYSVRLALF